MLREVMVSSAEGELSSSKYQQSINDV